MKDVLKDKSKNIVKREEIDKLLEGKEFLKTNEVYNKEISTIIEMLNLEEWNNSEFKYLFTKNIWSTNAQSIRKILSMEEWNDPFFKNLLGPNIWSCTPEKVKSILSIDKLKVTKFQKLLTRSIWTYRLQSLEEFFSIPEWEDEKYDYLLKPSILAFTAEQISSTFALFREYYIDDYITNRCIRCDTDMQRKIISYLKQNDLPLLIESNGEVKINPIINSNIPQLQFKYGINPNKLDKGGRKNR